MYHEDHMCLIKVNSKVHLLTRDYGTTVPADKVVLFTSKNCSRVAVLYLPLVEQVNIGEQEQVNCKCCVGRWKGSNHQI